MGEYTDPMDNLSINEKLILHQTKKMEKCFRDLQESIAELQKAVTAGNVVERLAYMAHGKQEPMKVIPDKQDDWKSL